MLSAATQAYLQQFGHAVVPRWLVWMSGRDRTTGELEYTGLWTGADDEAFMVEGESRAYFGAGSLISLDPLTFKAGAQVQMQRVTLGPLTPEMIAALRLYDPKFCPIQIHLALFHPDTAELVSIERMFKGKVNGAPISEAPLENGTSATVCKLSLASSARHGTKTLTTTKSDSDYRQRGGERGMRYADVSGSVEVWWGQKRS